MKAKLKFVGWTRIHGARKEHLILENGDSACGDYSLILETWHPSVFNSITPDNRCIRCDRRLVFGHLERALDKQQKGS